MKQSLKVILFSCLVGSILAGMFFFNIKNKAEAKTIPTIYAFQVGVFKNENNALAVKNNYKASKIVKDKDYYRVFIGVTIKNKELLENIFKEQENYYYIKELKVSEEVFNAISKYDELLMHTDKENIFTVIESSLENLKDEL